MCAHFLTLGVSKQFSWNKWEAQQVQRKPEIFPVITLGSLLEDACLASIIN